MPSLSPYPSEEIAAIDAAGLNKAADIETDLVALEVLGSTFVSDKATWVGNGSPGSGNTYNALVADAAALTAARVAIEASRVSFAQTVALAVQTLLEHPGYRPPTEAARFYDIAYVLAMLLAPSGTAAAETDSLTITPIP